MKIKKGHSNDGRTLYFLDGEKVYFSTRKRCVLFGLLQCSPCYRWLNLQDKNCVRSLKSDTLATMKGAVTFPDGVSDNDGKFVVLTVKGEEFATYLKEEDHAPIRQRERFYQTPANRFGRL